MTAHTASLINAITLICCSLWAYVSIGGSSWTALIPLIFGVALILCYPGIKSQNKLIAHIAVSLTLILLVALYMPLSSAVEDAATWPLVRVLLMVASTVFAIVFFIKSFRDARRTPG
ncbi:MAG: hypothetical protein AAF566_03920 [Pseudomonadota bacterium]